MCLVLAHEGGCVFVLAWIDILGWLQGLGFGSARGVSLGDVRWFCCCAWCGSGRLDGGDLAWLLRHSKGGSHGNAKKERSAARGDSGLRPRGLPWVRREGGGSTGARRLHGSPEEWPWRGGTAAVHHAEEEKVGAMGLGLGLGLELRYGYIEGEIMGNELLGFGFGLR